MQQQPLAQPEPTELTSQAQAFTSVTDQDHPLGDEGIVKNIDELKELLVEGKADFVDEEGEPLTTAELRELVDPLSPVGTPEAIP